jgi:DNA-binding LacI/PurR family transcriptional regulator
LRTPWSFVIWHGWHERPDDHAKPAATMTGRIQTRSTLAVVAREAGVSVPTVSKVLRARADVAPATRKRVRAVLDRLGFPPETLTARTAKVNAGLLDVVVRHMDSPRVGAILAGLAAKTRVLDVSVVINVASSRPSHPVPPRRWLDQIAARGTYGVVGVMVDFSAAQVDYLAAHDIAAVVIDPPTRVHDPVVAIRSDDRVVTQRLTAHLLADHHRRIAVLTGEDTLASRDRVAGFRDAMADARLPIPPGRIAAAHSAEEAASLTADLLRLAHPPSALLLAGEHGPAGAYRACTAAGRRIPQDVLLVAFDDLPMSATQVPGLRIVHRPVDAVVRSAISVVAGSRLSFMTAGERRALDVPSGDPEPIAGLPGVRLLRSPEAIPRRSDLVPHFA